MEFPDFLQYKDRFTKNGFVEKISRIARRAGSKLVYAALLLYYTLESDKISLKDKAIIIGALGYLISPLDVIPDAIPIAGLGDDLAVLIYVLNKVWGNVNEDVKAKSREKLLQWFDEEEIGDVDSNLFKDNPDSNPV
ncbi:MAG: YkvA family protein [Prevotella sp.]|nr:YkvA family protein [Prevotella sp.]